MIRIQEKAFAPHGRRCTWAGAPPVRLMRGRYVRAAGHRARLEQLLEPARDHGRKVVLAP